VLGSSVIGVFQSALIRIAYYVIGAYACAKLTSMNPTNYELANQDPNEWFAAQSEERVLLMMERAMRKVDIDEVPDEDHFMFDSYMEALMEEAKKCLIHDILDGMKEQGLIDVSVAEAGELMYNLTGKGIKLYDSLVLDDFVDDDEWLDG
jgi:hypothetical protein